MIVSGLAASENYTAGFGGFIHPAAAITDWLTQGQGGWVVVVAAGLAVVLAVAFGTRRQRRRVRQAIADAGGPERANVMAVKSVSFKKNRGVMASGRMESGCLRVGDAVQINRGRRARIDGIDKRTSVFRSEAASEATSGAKITVTFSDLDKEDVEDGDVITSADSR